MERPLKIGWISGWAAPSAWLGALARLNFPDAAHSVVPASPEALARLEAEAPFDWIAGYSLGSLLLLADAPRAERLGRVALLAPIFGFPSEAGLGGRVPLAQLRHLSRRLGRDPVRAVADFHAWAGLDVPEGGPDSSDFTGLAWGLDYLGKMRASPRLPEGWRAWCGDSDVLLDAARIRELEPAVSVVPGAGHHPGPLIRAFATSLQ